MLHSRDASLSVLALLIFVLALALAGCVTDETLEQTQPVVSEEPGDMPLPSDTPPAYPAPPTVQSEPTYTPPYPVPPTVAGGVPSLTSTATPWSVSALPPLPTYPPPGPFSGMRFLYLHKMEGYRTIGVEGLGEVPLDLTQNLLRIDMIRISPDGSKILYSLWNGMDWSDAQIWVMDPDGLDKQLVVEASEGAYPQGAIWSPDGWHIAFLKAYRPEDNPTYKEVWIMNDDGSEPHMVLRDSQASIIGVYPRAWFWARNGYLYSFDPQLEKLFAINPNDGNFYRLMDNVDPLDAMFALSPDGEHAANYAELTSSGFATIEVPGGNVRWSADGSTLVSLDSQGIWLHEVSSGMDELIVSGVSPYDAYLHGVSPDNRYVAYQTDEGIFIVDLADTAGQPKLVVEDTHTPTGNRALIFVTWLPVP